MSKPADAPQAVDLAEAVYLFSELPSPKEAMRALNARYGDLFTFPSDEPLLAKTGGPGFLKCRTAFGVCLVGQKNLKGHSFLVFRGTSYLADWLTNANFTLARSSNNQPVHAGFSDAFKSIRPQLLSLMPSISGTQIHCIGHSLGGAIASLCAEWIELAYHRKPCLYTFGAPRVGLHGFANTLSNTLSSPNIYRVYRRSDVVPYVPIWPFLHAPLQGRTYQLPAIGTMPTLRDHSIGEYATSIGSKSWPVLAEPKGSGSDREIEHWLLSNHLVSFSMDSLEWLGRALVYVLERCMTGAARLLSAAGSTQLTLLDSIAVILDKGIKLADTVSRWVLYLVRKILMLIGRPEVVESADISRTYLRHILMELQRKVNALVQRVLDQSLVNGRAV
ncbi:lipase family protein [Marinimicrobium sp. C6131]|uniref:lipase family protein n=1 Tax=Marinimicrobium sp. C6131 TaxID=3022676 RepID=UPI00223CEBBC|nr:lipase family protein [Marinimicrobium sp. C6131]UZJ45206.1 lipase family protein [Marinimicrobium sp. C6131]